MTKYDEMFEYMTGKFDAMKSAYDTNLAKEANLIAQIEMCQRSLVQVQKDIAVKQERNIELEKDFEKLSEFLEVMNTWGDNARFNPETQQDEFDAHGIDEGNWNKTLKEINKKIYGRKN